MVSRSRLIQLSNWLAGSVAVVVTVLVPVSYFTVSYQHATGSLEAEVEINSRIISGFVNANPELWQYEQMRLEEILQRRPRSGEKETRRILDLRNRVVAQSLDHIAPPLIKRSHELRDAGVAVARIEICRSMIPVLAKTAMAGLIGVLCGAIGFFGVRVLPFRALVQAEHDLKESEKRFRTIFNSSPLGMATLDLDCHCNTVNGLLSSMTQYDAEEFSGLGLRKLLHPDDLESVQQKIENLLEGRERVSVTETRVARKDGTYLPVQLTLSLVRDETAPTPAYFLSIWKDVSAERELERQLRESQKMEAVGQLAGGIAHDFNNILTTIIGYVSIMEMEKATSDPELQFLLQVKAAADKGAGLTRSLLAYSRKQLIQPQNLDLNEVIRGAEGLLATLLTAEIEFKAELADEGLPVLVDPTQIHRVLMNLAANARDAMPGCGSFTIRTRSCEMTTDDPRRAPSCAAGRFALIEISDTGIGIDPGTQSRMFDPFFTTKPVGEGTGLGLAVVHGIVKQHNGFIQVVSAPAEGTTFRIYFPLASAVALPVPQHAPAPEPVTGTETILVVEDEQMVRDLTKRIFVRAGYTVITAVDGDDAVETFRQHRTSVDLILMDVIMPKRNGIEAAAAIREMAPDVKVLFISGYTADIVTEKGLLREEENFIRKPVHVPDLLQKVQEVLQQRLPAR